MKDAECAVTNEKSIFRFIFLVMVIFVLKLPQFSMNFHDNLKNKIRKNRKIDFSFDSAHCASSIKTGAKLSGEGGVCIFLVGKRP